MKIDFSDLKQCHGFLYQKQYYEICCSIRDNRWYINKYNTLLDYARPWGTKGQRIGENFKDPDELLRTVTIGGLTLEEIIKDLPDDLSKSQTYEYNYELFLFDLFYPITEYEFIFRDRHFFICYNNPLNTNPEQIPGWVFGEMPDGILIYSKDYNNDFDAFIQQVDLWMREHVRVSLRDMFDHYYKEDQTGELRLGSIYMY